MKAHRLAFLLLLTLDSQATAWTGGIHRSGKAAPAIVGEWPGYLRAGPPEAMDISGDLAVISGSHGLQVLDVSVPTDPLRVGDLLPPSHASDVAVSGKVAAVALGELGLMVVDLTDAAAPTVRGFYSPPGPVHGVTMSNGYTYLSTGGWLHIVNLSDPSNPTLTGIFRRNVWPVVAQDNYAYGYDRHFKLFIVIDISDPTHPVERSRVPGLLRAVSDIAAEGDWVYVTDTDGLTTIDVSDPAAPQMVGARVGSAWRSVDVFGDWLIVADSSDGLLVFDRSDPANPLSVGAFEHERYSSVSVSGDRVFVIEDYSGLRVFGFDTGPNPHLLGSYDCAGSGRGATVRRDQCFLADGYGGLKILDVSDVSNIRQMGNLSWADVTLHRRPNCVDVSVSGDFAYVVGSDDSDWGESKIVDVFDPTQPEEVASMGLCVNFLEVFGEYGFWGGCADCVEVYSLSDPRTPRYVGLVPNTYPPICVEGGRLYSTSCAYPPGGQLLIHDLSTPAEPQLLGHSEIPDFGRIAVSADRVVLVTGRGLHIIDASDPTNPQQVSELPPFTGPLAVWGDYVVSAEQQDGALRASLLSIADPANPRILGEISGIPGRSGVYRGNHQEVERIDFANGRILLPAGSHGLYVLQVPPFFKSISRSDTTVTVSWEGWGQARLQRSTSLTSPDWQDVDGSETLSEITLPQESGSEFFRLASP